MDQAVRHRLGFFSRHYIPCAGNFACDKSYALLPCGTRCLDPGYETLSLPLCIVIIIVLALLWKNRGPTRMRTIWYLEYQKSNWIAKLINSLINALCRVRIGPFFFRRMKCSIATIISFTVWMLHSNFLHIISTPILPSVVDWYRCVWSFHEFCISLHAIHGRTLHRRNR